MPARSSPSEGSPHSQDAYLYDMLESARHIQRYMEGVGFEAFWDDSEKRDAVAMRLAVIGESARHVTPETAAKLKGVPFKDLCGMRNRIAHDYGRVDYAVVWRVTQDDIGVLVTALNGYLQQQSEPPTRAPGRPSGRPRGGRR
jgi:uncharacterized protein with HEPN domain